MKKILTTTVITAILATSGFAQTEPVGLVIYGGECFYDGTDTNDTTIMPSGDVQIGYADKLPLIASTWELKEGSVINVVEKGFQLTGTIKIKPNDAGAIPIQYNLTDDENLYYEYQDKSYIRYYKLVGEDGSAIGNFLTEDIDADRDVTFLRPSQPEDTALTQTMTIVTTGMPRMFGKRECAQIDMAYDSGAGAVQGKICGGTVTYAKEGATILSKDTTTTFADDSSLVGKTKFTLSKAEEGAFQECYLSDLPTLKCDTNSLDLTNKDTYSENVSDSSTLQSYLKSFGFYPNTTTVLDGTEFVLLTSKDASAAIQLPKGTAFSTAASGTKYEVKNNLHNVGSEEFDAALTFTGTNPTVGELDTLEFSGDNSNLVPKNGVTYTDVNVTVCDEDAWIKVPKDKIAVFQGSSNPTLKIDSNASFSHMLEVKSGSKFEIGTGKTVKVFGTLSLGD